MSKTAKSAAAPRRRAATTSYGAAIFARLGELAEITSEPGKLTRLYLSPAHRIAADRVLGWMREAGMTAGIDGIGNVIGRYEAATAGAPALLLGSHIDTVRDAGRFDGMLGVVAAIAVVARLDAAGRRLPFAIEVIAFGDEEGVRFPTTLAGSRALAGTFDRKTLAERDGDGITRRAALLDFGCDPARIGREARGPKQVLGYIEMHIEQGPVLEAEGHAVAVVSAINGATRGTVDVTGTSGHAGTTPMPLRRDALAAAAAIIGAIERRAAAGTDLVATVGSLDIANPAPNTIPGSVRFSLDVRSPSDSVRRRAVGDIEASIASVAAERNVQARFTRTFDAPAAACDPRLSDALAAAIAAHDLPVRRMPSGAGHDAMSFRDRIPFTMLFVRCRGGISHNPAEFATAADIDIAARVLERFVTDLKA